MSLEGFYFVSQMVAATAVLISLVFLAIEVRRNTTGARRQSLEDSTAHRSDFVRMIAGDGELASLIGRCLSDQEVNSAEWYRFSMFVYAIFVEFELNHRKFRIGDMDKDLWQAWMEAYLWWLQFPGTRRWWKYKPAGFTNEFRAYIDARIEADEVIDPGSLKLMSLVGKDRAAADSNRSNHID